MLRNLLREMEPPQPPELVVDAEAVRWFRTLTPPPLAGLDHFTSKMIHGEAVMELQEARRVLALIGTTEDSRISINGHRLSTAQGRAVEAALMAYATKEDGHEGTGKGRGNGDGPRREDRNNAG
jgi:hypothetical protein